MLFFYMFVVIIVTLFVIVVFAEEKIMSIPPIIYNNSTARHLNVKEGQLVRLQCFAGGFPNPMVWWKRDGMLYK